MTLREARQAAERIGESAQKLTGAMASKGFNLSDLSLPESFPGPSDLARGKDRTPQSKPGEHDSAPIEVESSPGSEPIARGPSGEGGSQRDLSQVFAGLDAEAGSPTVGSRV